MSWWVCIISTCYNMEYIRLYECVTPVPRRLDRNRPDHRASIRGILLSNSMHIKWWSNLTKMKGARTACFSIKRTFSSANSFAISYGPGGRSSNSGITATVFGGYGFVGRYLASELGKCLNYERMVRLKCEKLRFVWNEIVCSLSWRWIGSSSSQTNVRFGTSKTRILFDLFNFNGN